MSITIESNSPADLIGPVTRTTPSAKPLACPFTVLIDSAEQHPFSFTGLNSDAAHKYRPLIVSTRTLSLGRFPNSLGDYSIAGFEGRFGLERKSIDDAISTFLGWGERRERFVQELRNLNAIECGAVIVEADFSQVWRAARETLKKSADVNQQSLRNQIRAWQQDFPCVQWLFCGGRRDAEEEAFRWMWRFWEKRKNKVKAA